MAENKLTTEEIKEKLDDLGNDGRAKIKNGVLLTRANETEAYQAVAGVENETEAQAAIAQSGKQGS